MAKSSRARALNDDAFRAVFPYPYAVTYRPDLHNALLDACKAEAHVELTTAAKVEQGTGSHSDTDTLIGADGLWSNVRAKLIGVGAPRVSYRLPRRFTGSGYDGMRSYYGRDRGTYPLRRG